MMNIVDSSCWLEYFAGTHVGDLVEAAILDIENLVVPSICIYEVFKKIIYERDEDSALLAIAHMKQGTVIDLDSDLSILAAKIGKEFKLPMADSIIYASTKKYSCTLWTLDKHFENLENVNYIEMKRKKA